MRSGIPTAAFIIVLVLIALMAIVAGPESAGSSDPSPSGRSGTCTATS